MNHRLHLILCLGLVLASGQAWAGENEKELQESAKKGETASQTADQAKPADTDSYKIGAQDVLKVDVWKEPDITRQVTVRPDGKISLPLLNDIQAAGMSPSGLGASISDGLKKFITDPQVTVTVVEINSRRIYVTGEVQHAGAFALLPGMTILQALSSCGGFTQFANTKKIYLLRAEGEKQLRIPVNYKALVNGTKSEENVQLQSGDVIVVP
jgi:polysaccharide export outer membrane protein